MSGQYAGLLAGLRTALAAMEQCPASLGEVACHATLHSSLGGLLAIEPVPGAEPPSSKQQKRLATVLMSLLTALADDRHPCDDAWHTATFAIFKALDTCTRTQPVLAHQFVAPAGLRAQASVLLRLGNCCQGVGPPLGAQGVGAIAMVAKSVMSTYRRLHAIDPTSPALSSMGELAHLLLPLVLQLFEPPHHTAGACTCRTAALTAAAPVRARVDAELRDVFCAYGHRYPHFGPVATLQLVSAVCMHSVVVQGGSAEGPLVTAGLRRLCSMVLTLRVCAARQRGDPRAFGSAGAGNAALACFVDPGLLTLPACMEMMITSASKDVALASLALHPRHAPSCSVCLANQLLLVLEAAGLVDDPLEAAECYCVLFRTFNALASQGGPSAAPLHDFLRRAWPHMTARALEAARSARQVPEGTPDASHHAAVLSNLVSGLFASVFNGCHADDGAALDAICEAAARTRPPLMLVPACTLFVTRLQCILSLSGAQHRVVAHDGSPPSTLAAAAISLGKLLQLHGDAATPLAASRVCGKAVVSFYDAGAAGDDGVGELNSTTAGSVDDDGYVLAPWVQMILLLAARVDGAVARRMLLEGGEALFSTDVLEQVTNTAELLLRCPLLWDAVQRATHGRVAPFDISPDPSPQPTAEAPTAQGGGTAGPQHADSHTSTSCDAGSGSGEATSASGGGASASACADALRFLAELHDWLDPHALGVRLPGCYNPRCANLSGASEADLPVRMCSGCRVARYCSAACSKQHWRWHKAACRPPASSTAQP